MARKLGVSQGEIVRFLSSQNMGIEEGSNVKLEERHIRSLYAHFAPSVIFDPAQLQAEPPPAPEVEPPPAQLLADINSTSQETTSELSAVTQVQATENRDEPVFDSTTTTSFVDESTNTIRAPKIELAGLKVLGKIELPGPKKKEVSPTEDAPKTETEASPEQTAPDVTRPDAERRESSKTRMPGRDQEDRRRPRNKQPREQRPYKNPIAAQRERELEEEQERRKEKAAQEKARRTQNYQKRVKNSPPTKAARLIEEPVEQLNASTIIEEPTTWLGKFVKWLKT